MLKSWLHAEEPLNVWPLTADRAIVVCVMHADLTAADNGNYTCEIRGSNSNVLASQTFSITVQGVIIYVL